MSEQEYKSETLTVNVEDHDCAVCRFLNGSRKQDDLLETIRILDANLAGSESAERTLRETILTLSGQLRDLKFKLENRL
jgi:hypothetical protein